MPFFTYNPQFRIEKRPGLPFPLQGPNHEVVVSYNSSGPFHLFFRAGAEKYPGNRLILFLGL